MKLRAAKSLTGIRFLLAEARFLFLVFSKTVFLAIIGSEVKMKNKIQISHQVVLTKKPPKAEISEAEFRRRLRNIDEWRKKCLAELRTENPR